MNKFNAHLHVHTEYSALDGMSKIEELIVRAKELGQTAIAITDHGNSAGLFEAYKLGVKHEFKVILGEEFYFENTSNELKLGHLILLAKNEKGLENIFRLQRLAYNNFYYKPRINIDMLKEHNEGLICTTACIANKVGQLILKDEPQLAVAHILELRTIFGEDLYVELQSTTSPDVMKVNAALDDICKGYRFKTVITSDVHYTYKEDYAIHEVMLCMQQKAKMLSSKRWKFEHNDYWLKSHEEIVADLEGVSEEIIDASFGYIDEIVDKCQVTITPTDHMPKFLPTTTEEEITLWHDIVYGMNKKVNKRSERNDEFWKDIHKEFSVIKETGYAGYFLIVADYVNWARENGILVGDGRGSGAGSKVAYTIGITDINPQQHNLLFERFLTPGRVPDSNWSRAA